MNTSNNKVKKYLQIDSIGIRALISIVETDKDKHFLATLLGIMEEKTLPTSNLIEDIKHENIAHVFWKAYGKKESE